MDESSGIHSDKPVGTPKSWKAPERRKVDQPAEGPAREALEQSGGAGRGQKSIAAERVKAISTARDAALGATGVKLYRALGNVSRMPMAEVKDRGARASALAMFYPKIVGTTPELFGAAVRVLAVETKKSDVLENLVMVVNDWLIAGVHSRKLMEPATAEAFDALVAAAKEHPVATVKAAGKSWELQKEEMLKAAPEGVKKKKSSLPSMSPGEEDEFVVRVGTGKWTDGDVGNAAQALREIAVECLAGINMEKVATAKVFSDPGIRNLELSQHAVRALAEMILLSKKPEVLADGVRFLAAVGQRAAKGHDYTTSHWIFSLLDSPDLREIFRALGAPKELKLVEVRELAGEGAEEGPKRRKLPFGPKSTPDEVTEDRKKETFSKTWAGFTTLFDTRKNQQVLRAAYKTAPSEDLVKSAGILSKDLFVLLDSQEDVFYSMDKGFSDDSIKVMMPIVREAAEVVWRAKDSVTQDNMFKRKIRNKARGIADRKNVAAKVPAAEPDKKEPITDPDKLYDDSKLFATLMERAQEVPEMANALAFVQALREAQTADEVPQRLEAMVSVFDAFELVYGPISADHPQIEEAVAQLGAMDESAPSEELSAAFEGVYNDLKAVLSKQPFWTKFLQEVKM